MEQQTELEQILSMSVGDFLSYPNGEGELTEGQEIENKLTGFELNTTMNYESVHHKPSKELEDFLSQRISVDLLKELFIYNKEKGLLKWNINYRSIIYNTSVGTINNDGYLKVEIAGKAYSVHNLIWIIENNRYPSTNMVIDHIDGNRTNNHIDNLREITIKGNAQNRTNKISGLPLYVYKHRDKYAVRVTTDKARAYGSYRTIEEALIKRDEVCKQLNITLHGKH